MAERISLPFLEERARAMINRLGWDKAYVECLSGHLVAEEHTPAGMPHTEGGPFFLRVGELLEEVKKSTADSVFIEDFGPMPLMKDVSARTVRPIVGMATHAYQGPQGRTLDVWILDPRAEKIVDIEFVYLRDGTMEGPRPEAPYLTLNRPPDEDFLRWNPSYAKKLA